MSELSRLKDQEALLEASLRDAKSELEAGELSLSHYESLVKRDEEALAAVRDAIASWHEAPAKAKTKRSHRRVYLLVSLLCFAGVVGFLLYSALSPRQAGQQITGGLSLSNQEQVNEYLTEAENDVAAGNIQTALVAYQDVLGIDASNIEALTQVGWLDFSAGSAAKNQTVVQTGVNDLQKAIELSPRSAAPRLYYAIVAYSTPGYQKTAKNQFEEFLALKPSSAQLAIAKPFLQKLGLS
jgi:tetratricopeptide (TPR) repeat protein